MDFPASYFEDEIMNGFYVDGRMKCCWAAQIKVLKLIDDICKKYSIEYFVEWGSLLGTVRHGGFIPWDDDFDICMKRPDYNKFNQVAKKELPKGYDILNYRNQEDYWDVMSRVLNSQMCDFSDEFLDENYNFPYTAGIDIFPLDYVTRNKAEEEIQRDLVNYVKSVADTYGVKGMDPEDLEYSLKEIEKLTKQKVDRTGNIREQLYNIVCGLYSLYNEYDGDELALMAIYLDTGGCIYSKNIYSDTIRMPFENISVPVPVGYDYLLKKKYGNYMKCVRKGGSHDYPYFEKQEEYILARDFNIPKYDYEPASNERNPKFKDSQLSKIDLLNTIHEKIELCLIYQEIETALSLLSECQNLAITIGDALDRKVGEGSQCVAYLEKYCEVVFQIFDNLSNNNILPGSDVRAILDKMSDIVRTELDTMHIKKEIVFMPYRIIQWPAIEHVWKKACEDTDADVKVVPIPYFYKKRFGRELKELQYDGDKFPEYIDIIPYEEYNLSSNHPDEIYIQAPYDKWNYSVTVHPNYYSEDLRKNTEKLIYIPWFTIDEFDPADERGLKSRNYFIPMPGVVNADRVIVQSEKMKESYIDYLTKWAGEDTSSIWKEKISYLEKENLLPPIKEIRSDLWDGKKAVLYFISANGLLEHKYDMISKIKETLKIFKESADNIKVIWLQEAYLEDNVKSRDADIYYKYRELVKKYQGEEWLSISMPGDEKNLISTVDAYYGDAGRWAQLSIQNNKPVMLQDVTI